MGLAMKKKLITLTLSAIMLTGLALNAAADPVQNEMLITHPEDGVTKGSREEK